MDEFQNGDDVVTFGEEIEAAQKDLGPKIDTEGTIIVDGADKPPKEADEAPDGEQPDGDDTTPRDDRDNDDGGVTMIANADTVDQMVIEEGAGSETLTDDDIQAAQDALEAGDPGIQDPNIEGEGGGGGFDFDDDTLSMTGDPKFLAMIAEAMGADSVVIAEPAVMEVEGPDLTTTAQYVA